MRRGFQRVFQMNAIGFDIVVADADADIGAVVLKGEDPEITG